MNNIIGWIFLGAAWSAVATVVSWWAQLYLRARRREPHLPDLLPPRCPHCAHVGTTLIYANGSAAVPTYSRGSQVSGFRALGIANHARFACWACEGELHLRLSGCVYPLRPRRSSGPPAPVWPTTRT